MTTDFWAARSRKAIVFGVAGTLVAVAALVLLAETGRGEFVGYLLAAASIAVAIWTALQRPPQIAHVVAKREQQTQDTGLRHGLADGGKPEPADVGFRVPRADTEPDLVGWRDDGGAATGTLWELKDYYLGLEQRRMAVLGEPGAGKTIAARWLVREVNRALLASPTPGSERPVPVLVLLSLPSWNVSDEWLRTASDEKLVDSLDAWIATHLVEVHRIRRSDARRLVDEERVVPVLDGLDEMDSANRPDRPRASTVVHIFNQLSGSRPVVLVCRRAEYLTLASGRQRPPGEPPVVQDIQQIILEDMSDEVIREYLRRRFPDSTNTSGVRSRWEPVFEALKSRDGSGADLAGVLSRPWQLFLAVHAYYDTDSDPSELLRIPPSELTGHLLDRLIPAMTSRYPHRGRRSYDPREVEELLARLNRLLRDTHHRHEWSRTDLRLDDLWPIAGWLAPRILTAILRAVPYAAAAAALARLQAATTFTPLGIAVVVAISLLGLWAAWRESDPRPRPAGPRDIRPAMRRQHFLGDKTSGLVIGTVGGLFTGWFIGYQAGPLIGLAGGLSIGVVGGIATGLLSRQRDRMGMDRPSRFLRRDLAFDFMNPTLPIIAMAVVFEIWLILLGGPTGGAVVVLMVLAAAGGALLGMLGVLTISRWPRYGVAVAIAAVRGILPARPAKFLDWAYGAGLLRLSGVAVQFRHQELQDWLDVRDEQAWFRWPEWQAGEREADEEIAADLGHHCDSPGELEAYLAEEQLPSSARVGTGHAGLPTFHCLPRFRRDHERLDAGQRRAFRSALRQMTEDLQAGGDFRPELRARRIQRTNRVRELTWGSGGRATWQYGDEVQSGRPHIILRRVGIP